MTPLTPRETEVLRLLAAGRTDKEIAAALRLSLHTVAHVVASIRHKVGADSRAHAAAIGVREGLIA